VSLADKIKVYNRLRKDVRFSWGVGIEWPETGSN